MPTTLTQSTPTYHFLSNIYPLYKAIKPTNISIIWAVYNIMILHSVTNDYCNIYHHYFQSQTLSHYTLSPINLHPLSEDIHAHDGAINCLSIGHRLYNININILHFCRAIFIVCILYLNVSFMSLYF